MGESHFFYSINQHGKKHRFLFECWLAQHSLALFRTAPTSVATPVGVLLESMTFRHSHTRQVLLQQRIHLTTSQSFFSWPLHIAEFHRLLWWLLGLRGVDALPCEDSDHRKTESTKLSAISCLSTHRVVVRCCCEVFL